MKKVNCILLVDDDEFDNFYHEMNIRQAGVCDHIKIACDGESALDYLSRSAADEPSFPKPDIIYLDINMPRINGFDFLDELKNMDRQFISGIVIIMLSTSLNPNDISKALSYPEVKEFQNKPLTSAMVKETVEKCF